MDVTQYTKPLKYAIFAVATILCARYTSFDWSLESRALGIKSHLIISTEKEPSLTMERN